MASTSTKIQLKNNNIYDGNYDIHDNNNNYDYCNYYLAIFLDKIEATISIEFLQKAALLGIARILRRPLELYEAKLFLT